MFGISASSSSSNSAGTDTAEKSVGAEADEVEINVSKTDTDVLIRLCTEAIKELRYRRDHFGDGEHYVNIKSRSELEQIREFLERFE